MHTSIWERLSALESLALTRGAGGTAKEADGIG